MAWNVNRWVMLLPFLLLSVSYSAQDVKTMEVDSLWWEQKINDLDYSEKKPEFEQIDRTGKGPNLSWLFSPEVTYTVLFIIVAILLFLFYRLYLKNLLENTSERKERSYKYFKEEDLEDHFYEMDLQDLLDSALNSKDWKMAIRIYYLMLLKRLIDNGSISWHRDLTNLQISRQLADRKTELCFREIIDSVELFWYGDQESESKDYQRFENLVKEFYTVKKEVGDEG